MDKLIEQFLQYLRTERRRNAGTVVNYRFYLKRFVSWGQITSPADITSGVIDRYRRWLSRDIYKHGKTLNSSTQNYHLIALRSFLKFLSLKKILTLSPGRVALIHLPPRRISVIDNADTQRLLDAPLQTKEPRVIQLRDKAILELLFATGLRVSELAHLTRADVNLTAGTAKITSRTGGRTVHISNHVRQWLSQYLTMRKDAVKYIFIRHDRAQHGEYASLTPRSIQRLLKQYGKQVGLTAAITPRIMRSSMAARLLSKGTGLNTVQAVLGHLSKTTTQAYRHVVAITEPPRKKLFGWKKKKRD